MELIEIKGLFDMDRGAPSPTILSNDNELFVIFYGDKPSEDHPQERNIVYDTGIFVLSFKNCLKHAFGLPSNETIHGHPYSRLGLKSFSFYELRGSNMIAELCSIEKVHPQFDGEKWAVYKHYILTFHDNMFECVAQEFEIREENASLYSQVSVVLNELSVRHFQ